MNRPIKPAGTTNVGPLAEHTLEKIKHCTLLHFTEEDSVRNGDGDAVVQRISEEGDGGSEISGILNIISINWCRDGADPLWKRGQENKEREKI